jgi:hypothetical protein
LGTSYKYDIYILVFRKGDASQVFERNGPLLEIFGTRNLQNQTQTQPTSPELYVPSLWRANYDKGVYDETVNPPVRNAVPPIGTIGIGDTSGTVFRQGYDSQQMDTGAAIARPFLLGQAQKGNGGTYKAPLEKIIFAPGPFINGTGKSSEASPLIYVYQTTMQF